eukprot:TRINITY_DN1690_c0_g1_i1.p1 TRINITY_DN1690_c0_g1~~TRINITY_DN1690_c0_g1_i1.p1  ORF type:complete len:111 (-),score=19.56 TRINITY_DN1690_c0_g1_i1:86-382(-)
MSSSFVNRLADQLTEKTISVHPAPLVRTMTPAEFGNWLASAFSRPSTIPSRAFHWYAREYIHTNRGGAVFAHAFIWFLAFRTIRHTLVHHDKEVHKYT